MPLVLFFSILGCGTPQEPESIYPFQCIAYHEDFGYGIIAEVEGDLYADFYNFFESRGYTGNGYTWRGVIERIIKDQNPLLSQHIHYDEEAGAVCMFLDTENHRKKVLELIVPYFSDKQKLSRYLETLDRESIDD